MSIDAYFTQNGNRPDLAAALGSTINPPEQYLFDSIYPISTVVDKAGTVYYATVTADVTGQTGRSAGVEPTTTQISDSSTTYTAAEIISRGALTFDESRQLGGVEKADLAGAKFCQRNVFNALENLVATAVVGGSASASWDAAKALTVVQTGLDSIRLYYGKTALVGSTTTIKKMVQGMLADDAYGPVLSRLVSGSTPEIAASGLGFENWKAGIAMMLGVDEVLAGDDNIWQAGSNANRFALVKIDDSADPISPKYNPVLGRTYMFLPDDTGNPWSIQSFADLNTLNNKYTAVAWANVKTLNSGAAYLVDGVV